MGSKLFINSLKSGSLKDIRAVPKSDLHNHCMMGGRLKTMEKFYGKKLEKFKIGKEGITGINNWLSTVYRPVLLKEGSFLAGVEAAFLQARSDGVTILEMSIDVFLGKMLNIHPDTIISIVDTAHKTLAPAIIFHPELGFNRSHPLRSILAAFEPYLDLGYFKGIDLYDIETAQPVENFKELYRLAKKLGLKCKAHAGEFGTAESVREAVEVLDLDAVQHGIGAADSPEIMKWLAERGTVLNLCPASNIALRRVRSYKTHPIRILYDHGVKVTINTDDVMLFGQGNSEQYLKLYRSRLFSAEELDQIRMNGIS